MALSEAESGGGCEKGDDRGRNLNFLIHRNTLNHINAEKEIQQKLFKRWTALVCVYRWYVWGSRRWETERQKSFLTSISFLIITVRVRI